MADARKQLVGCGARLDFWRSDQTNFLIGFFGETGLIDMLESFDCDAADIVSPFIGAIVHEFRGLFETAEATNIFTEYVDMASCMYKKYVSPG